MAQEQQKNLNRAEIILDHIKNLSRKRNLKEYEIKEILINEVKNFGLREIHFFFQYLDGLDSDVFYLDGEPPEEEKQKKKLVKEIRNLLRKSNELKDAIKERIISIISYENITDLDILLALEIILIYLEIDSIDEIQPILNKFSFIQLEIPEATEPSTQFFNLLKQLNLIKEDYPLGYYFVNPLAPEDVKEQYLLLKFFIMLSEILIKIEKYKHAESILRTLYLFEIDPFYPDALIKLLIHVSLKLGKYSQALRYLEDYRDLYLKGEVSLDDYTEALIFVSQYIPQGEIKSISPGFDLIYEMYKKNQKLKEENYKLKEIVNELTGPEKSLKSEFGILWENFDDITKQNLIKARKAEIQLKENNELFRDIVMGYFDATVRELEKLIDNFNPTKNIENISILQKFEFLLNRKEFNDYLNKNTMGGAQHIRQSFKSFIKPLAEIRNKLAHQNSQIPETSEINSFLSQKISGIIKFLIQIQPRI